MENLGFVMILDGSKEHFQFQFHKVQAYTLFFSLPSWVLCKWINSHVMQDFHLCFLDMDICLISFNKTALTCLLNAI